MSVAECASMLAVALALWCGLLATYPGDRV